MKMMRFVLVLSLIVAIRATTYELIPAIEYDGDLYVPLSQIRAVREANPRHSGSEADASSSANSQTYNPGYGGYGGGRNHPSNPFTTHGNKGGYYPNFGGPKTNGGGAKAGASGGGFGSSDSTANAQSQTFTGNGFSGSASSASASSHSSSSGGRGNLIGGGAGSNAAATAQSESKAHT